MGLAKRLNTLIKRLELSQIDFSKEIDHSVQSVSKLIAGRTQSPKADLIAAITKRYPEVNLRWLLIGEGEMWLTEEEIAQQSSGTKQTREIELLTQQIKAKDEVIEGKDEIIKGKEEVIILLKQQLKDKK